MEKIIIAYVPVLHDGYRKFFERHNDASVIYILGKDLISQVYYLSKEIRELDPELMVKAIDSLKIIPHVQVKIIAEEILKDFAKKDAKKLEIIMPDEDVSRLIAEKYLGNQQVIFDTIFLRWDKHNTVLEKPVIPDNMISKKEFDIKILNIAEKEAEKSSDWWRRVGTAVVRDGSIIIQTHNAHVPSEHTPYVNGDPRNAFSKGINIELGTSIHAEACAVAEAARKGITLEGADMYVSVFPCPPCAKLIAYSGIKTLYCGGGYGILDGQDILKSKGVKIIFVENEKELGKEGDSNKKTEKKWEGYKK